MLSDKVENVTLIAGVNQLVNDTNQRGGHTVIVCPDSNMTTRVAGIVGSVVSNDEKFAGYTALFENKGRITVVCVDDNATDVLKESPFKVMFMGWTAKDNSKGMSKWQSPKM